MDRRSPVVSKEHKPKKAPNLGLETLKMEPERGFGRNSWLDYICFSQILGLGALA